MHGRDGRMDMQEGEGGHDIHDGYLKNAPKSGMC